MANSTRSRSKPPAELSVTAGQRLVNELSNSLPEGSEWDERETAYLSLASKVADDIATLEELLEKEGATVVGSTGQTRLNPIFAELRQQRLALAKILGDVRIPEESTGIPSKNVKKVRAAETRWKGVK